MSEELLPYYQRELDFIRQLGGQFADANPKIASRLRLRAEGAQDPHVERMIEAFAYLNARIRYKLDDDFPEVAEGLLDVLYPHLLAPVPSMSIARMELDPSQAELTSGYSISTGTPVETAPIDGQPCRFQTCYPLTLWPIKLQSVSLAGPPFRVPATNLTTKTQSVLQLTLNCLSPQVNFAQLNMGTLRFFLKGQSQHVFPLYELLFNNTLGISLANSAGEGAVDVLKPECIRPVGFERDEGMLPYPDRSFLGYRLLTEYFTFPEKFLFFDLDLSTIPPNAWSRLGNQLEIYFFLNRSVPEIESRITRDTFRLGCTPIVNLFRQRAEPIRLTHHDFEYRVVPDARHPMAVEVYSVDSVVATSPQNEEAEYQPFYSFKHVAGRKRQQRFWQANRRSSVSPSTIPDYGTEVFLRLVDLEFTPQSSSDWTLDVEVTCLNRDLPHRLPFGGGEPRLQLPKGGPVTGIECLTPPTRTHRPSLRKGVIWRLISHLSLNHVSLVDFDEGADALREILKTYDFADSDETRSTIDGISSVRSRRVVGRAGNGTTGGLCRGTEVTIQFDEERFVGSGIYLFASVLERFLGLYCSMNSFSKLVATTNKREGALRKWPPRAGEKVLL